MNHSQWFQLFHRKVSIRTLSVLGGLLFSFHTHFWVLLLPVRHYTEHKCGFRRVYYSTLCDFLEVNLWNLARVGSSIINQSPQISFRSLVQDLGFSKRKHNHSIVVHWWVKPELWFFIHFHMRQGHLIFRVRFYFSFKSNFK